MGLLRLTPVVVGLQAFLAVALISKPNAADKTAPSDKKAPSEKKAADKKKPSGLSKEWQKKYKDVGDEIKGLKTPFVNWKSNFAQAPPTPQAEQAQSFLGECSFIGGLLSAQLTPRCCNNVQVVTQQKLAQYDLAKDCHAGWDCDADHRTPSKDFVGKSLSEFCGEPGCLPRVVKAMKDSRETAPGANMMSTLCSSLGSPGADVSALLHDENDGPSFLKTKVGPLEKGHEKEIGEEIVKNDKSPKPKLGKKFEVDGEHGKNEVWKKKVAKCEKDVCSKKEKKLVLCETSIDKNDPCYIHCCDPPAAACFPGEALVNKEGVGAVPLGDIKVGDRVLVERSGELVHEPILAFLHALRNNRMAYLTVTHSLGEFRASSTHLVFVKSVDGGLVSKTVGELQVGDQLLFASGKDHFQIHSLVSSEVVSKMHSHGTIGMFAPLTASGTVVVDGVVASNYASPSHSKHLPHRLAHAFLFPVRFYHQVGFATLLKPFWAWLCHDAGSTEAKHWICQGAGVDHKSATDVEDLHPYLAVLYKGLKVDWLLSAGRSESGNAQAPVIT